MCGKTIAGKTFTNIHTIIHIFFFFFHIADLTLEEKKIKSVK